MPYLQPLSGLKEDHSTIYSVCFGDYYDHLPLNSLRRYVFPVTVFLKNRLPCGDLNVSIVTILKSVGRPLLTLE
jgi:hypothetical protein